MRSPFNAPVSAARAERRSTLLRPCRVRWALPYPRTGCALQRDVQPGTNAALRPANVHPGPSRGYRTMRLRARVAMHRPSARRPVGLGPVPDRDDSVLLVLGVTDRDEALAFHRRRELRGLGEQLLPGRH